MKRFIYKMIAKFKYRKIPYNEVCCCGEPMNGHVIYTSNHSPRCAKEYAITSYFNSKLKREI